MSITEFGLIEKYFHQTTCGQKNVAVGMGDDCALVGIPKGQQLAITVDTVVEGTHFLPSTSAEDLAWKAIAVNLSDLAAMGAEPAWLTLSLTLPETDKKWLEAFNHGFFKCLDFFNLQLIGGDTTKGPLAVTIQAMGFVPPGAALLRSGARPGDVIFITGTIGDAGLGLAITSGKHKPKNSTDPSLLIQKYNRPIPRVAVGLAIRNIASAAIDLSDGLAGDISHILKASGVGATIALDRLPLSDTLLSECDFDTAIEYALSSGDDYELCFTVPEESINQLETALRSTGCSFIKVGRITGGHKLKYINNGNRVKLDLSGFCHFQTEGSLPEAQYSPKQK